MGQPSRDQAYIMNDLFPSTAQLTHLFVARRSIGPLTSVPTRDDLTPSDSNSSPNVTVEENSSGPMATTTIKSPLSGIHTPGNPFSVNSVPTSPRTGKSSLCHEVANL